MARVSRLSDFGEQDSACTRSHVLGTEFGRVLSSVAIEHRVERCAHTSQARHPAVLCQIWNLLLHVCFNDTHVYELLQ